MNRRVTDKEMYPALWIVLVVCGAGFLLWRYPLGQPTISGCWLWQCFKVYCPGCGGTRALVALSGGEWAKAFYYHPAVPVTAGIVAIYLLSQTIWHLRGKKGWALHYNPRWPWLLLGLLLANCAVRNLLWLGFGIPI